ncbi:MAG: type II and III secretion system protein [Planctomycetota bacterium]|nr:MAG: type II and III secretion system protein [Planctomycetota bacterium]
MPAAPRGIRPVQYTGPDGKPLPEPLEALFSVDDKLKVVHHRSQLIRTKERILRTAVADPSVIEVVTFSENELAIIGLSLGTTTLTLWFDGDPDPLIYEVETIRDPDLEERREIDYGKLERKLAVLFPNSKVYIIPLTRRVIVKGQARDSEEAAQILSIVRSEVLAREGFLGTGLGQTAAAAGAVGVGNNAVNAFGLGNNLFNTFIINMLEVPGEYQVMLHVRIAELDRNQLREMGVDINTLFNMGRHAISATSTIQGLAGTVTGIFENGEIEVLISWLARHRTAKILAEPTLTVLSGHSASFLSGGEFPVPTIVGVQGAQGTTTTFRGFGTSLFVTPTVLRGDLIRMQIVPEFSQINDNIQGANGIQALNVRRAQTTVELREGQTIVIAGLIGHQSDVTVTRIPWLGELPWIGPLVFNSKRASMGQTELLIMVTPELVRPMEPDEVPPLPGHEVTHPNDYELYKYAMTEGAPDTNVYQTAPYGSGSSEGMVVPYQLYNPAPASPSYTPQGGTALPFGGAAPVNGGFGMPATPIPGGLPGGYVPSPTPGTGMPAPAGGPGLTAPLTPMPDQSVGRNMPGRSSWLRPRWMARRTAPASQPAYDAGRRGQGILPAGWNEPAAPRRSGILPLFRR